MYTVESLLLHTILVFDMCYIEGYNLPYQHKELILVTQRVVRCFIRIWFDQIMKLERAILAPLCALQTF